MNSHLALATGQRPRSSRPIITSFAVRGPLHQPRHRTRPKPAISQSHGLSLSARAPRATQTHPISLAPHSLSDRNQLDASGCNSRSVCRAADPSVTLATRSQPDQPETEPPRQTARSRDVQTAHDGRDSLSAALARCSITARPPTQAEAQQSHNQTVAISGQPSRPF